jgi:hypothetical protein
MKEKIKRYRLPLSELFPAYHPKKRLPTYFEGKIRYAINLDEFIVSFPESKIHTCRENYEYWKKRIDKVNAGLAVLEVYCWVGKPYGEGSTTRVLFTFDKDSGIGVQQISIHKLDGEYICFAGENTLFGNTQYYESKIDIDTLAANDGLSIKDFEDWFAPKFKKSDFFEGAIIHFTKFRY